MNEDKLYGMMPTAAKATIVSVARNWYLSFGDRKLLNDYLSLLAKSLPTIALLVASTLIPITIWFRKTVEKNYHSNPTLFWCVVSVILTLVVSQLLSIRNERIICARVREKDFDRIFEILQYVSLTNIVNEFEIQYAYRYLLKPKTQSAFYFDFVYQWTGLGPTQIIPRNKKFRVEDRGAIRAGYRVARIHFDRAVGVGETIKCEFVFHSLFDPKTAPDPRNALTFSSNKYPRLNTHMMINFEAIIPSGLYREYSYGASYMQPLRNDPVELADQRLHHWPVAGIRGWIYTLRWEL